MPVNNCPEHLFQELCFDCSISCISDQMGSLWPGAGWQCSHFPYYFRLFPCVWQRRWFQLGAVVGAPVVLVILNILQLFFFFPPVLCVCIDILMCVLSTRLYIIHNLLFEMHFSQRDSADSWLEVATKIWNYWEFILGEVYKTQKQFYPFFTLFALILGLIPVGFLRTQ